MRGSGFIMMGLGIIFTPVSLALNVSSFFIDRFSSFWESKSSTKY